MEIKAFSDKVVLNSSTDVLRLHLYFKFLQYGIKPYENDLNIIIDLYVFGGYSNSDEQTKFIDQCISRGLKKSHQSLRNTFSKYLNIGVLEKPKNRVLHVSEKFIPKVKFDRLVLQHVISHAK